ncbi:response regulator [Rhizobium bangladeshense]|nr:response regulator [Rhizobium bangladeshense]
MSLLDLLYLEEPKSDTVITAVRQWCTRNGCEIGSDNGKRAVAVAVRLAKSGDGGGVDLFASLSREMSVLADHRSIGLVLLVEDEPLVALDLEQSLQDAGFTVAVCMSCSDALHWLAEYSPSTGVLDVRLKDGSCNEVASLLDQGGIPFVVCSGSEQADAEAIFSRGEWLSKPCDPEALLAAVRRAVLRVSGDDVPLAARS